MSYNKNSFYYKLKEKILITNNKLKVILNNILFKKDKLKSNNFNLVL